MTDDDLRVIRFRVRRGEFRIPHALRDEDPDDWARRFASSVPEGANVTSYRSGSDDVFRWRIVTAYRCRE